MFDYEEFRDTIFEVERRQGWAVQGSENSSEEEYDVYGKAIKAMQERLRSVEHHYGDGGMYTTASPSSSQ